jgi:non-ribosomal peptide synthetase component F
VLVPEEIFPYPAKLVDFLKINGVTTIFWVPSILTTLANFKILDEAELPPLKNILFAGEVMPARTLNYWRRKYPAAVFSNLYGPTEITVDCTYYTIDREFGDDDVIPIGFPCRNTDILILTEENQEAKEEEQGELCVRGSSLALGYWNNPEKTAAAFTQNPLNRWYPERIYRTGDLVYRNRAGEIIFVGRRDLQIKHMGYRIELGEIEHACLQTEGVRNCCVVYNKKRSEITLFYEGDQELAPGPTRERLLAFLPKYMLPTVFRRVERLPRNSSGKIDRQDLLGRLG